MTLRPSKAIPQVRHNPDGVSFRMEDADGRRVDVFVTRMALHELDGYTKPQDRFAALQIFDEHRGLIEDAAVRTFEAGDYEHVGDYPAIVLRADDLQISN